MQPQLDASILSAALTGLELQRQRIEDQITQVKEMLSGRPSGSATTSASGEARPRRTVSAATRRKMALAQQRRFAALRSETASEQANAAKQKKKRKLSPEAIERIRAGVKKRWAMAKKQAAVKSPAKKKATLAK